MTVKAAIFIKDMSSGSATIWRHADDLQVVPRIGETLETGEHSKLRVTEVHHCLDGDIQILTVEEYPE